MKKPFLQLSCAGLATLLVLTVAACETTRRPIERPAVTNDNNNDEIFWPDRARLGDHLDWTSVAFPTGDPDTSVIGLNKGMPREARINQPFEYEMIVTNLTSMTLDNVTVQEEYGPHFTFDRSMPAEERIEDDRVVWNLGSLEPFEARMVTVRGVGAETGVVMSCAHVTYTTALCMGVPIVSPELELTLQAPEEVLVCDDIVYTFIVSNSGTGTVSDVRVMGPLAEGLGRLNGQQTLDFNVGTLAPGQTQEFIARVRADRTGTFEHRARIIGAYDLSAESNVVQTVVQQPELQVVRTTPELRFVDRDIEVEITITNVGDGIAHDLVVHDAVPPDFQFMRASHDGRFADGRVQWQLDPLAPDASRTVEVVYRAPRIGSVLGTATAMAYCAETVTDESVTDVRGIPALLLEGADHPDPVEVGSTTTYTLTVTNQGSADLTDVVLRCAMENGERMEMVSAQGMYPMGELTGTEREQVIRFPEISRLAPGAQATFEIVVRALEPGQVSFRAEAVSNEVTRPLIKVETTTFYE